MSDDEKRDLMSRIVNDITNAVIVDKTVELLETAARAYQALANSVATDGEAVRRQVHGAVNLKSGERLIAAMAKNAKAMEDYGAKLIAYAANLRQEIADATGRERGES